MTQTGGLNVLFAWCIFGGLLTVLAWFVLRHHADPTDEARRVEAQAPDPHGQGPSQQGARGDIS